MWVVFEDARSYRNKPQLTLLASRSSSGIWIETGDAGDQCGVVDSNQHSKFPIPGESSAEDLAAWWERERRELGSRSDLESWLRLVAGHYLVWDEKFPLGAHKEVLRVLSHMEESHGVLEARLLDHLEIQSNLLGQKLGALGACGGSLSLAKLEGGLAPESLVSPFVRKMHDTALARLRRRVTGKGRVSLSVLSIPAGVSLFLECVSGVEDTLASVVMRECGGMAKSVRSHSMKGEVEVRTGGAWAWDWVDRVRLFEQMRFEAGQSRNVIPADAVASVWADAAMQSGLPGIVESCTEGARRFAVRVEGATRIASRQLVAIARALEDRLNCGSSEVQGSDQWVNDPRTEDWVFVFRETHKGYVPSLRLDRRLWDHRFEYRGALVPAASKPTVAAFLAEWAGRLPDGARILDPFCGSGMELIECGMRFPTGQLFGGDTSPEALDAAGQNARAAGVTVHELRQCDVSDWLTGVFDLVVTNPPFGKRARVDDIVSLLETFLRMASGQLIAGGRVVWICPQPKRCSRLAAGLGFSIERRARLDLGGFDVEAQVLRKT